MVNWFCCQEGVKFTFGVVVYCVRRIYLYINNAELALAIAFDVAKEIF